MHQFRQAAEPSQLDQKEMDASPLSGRSRLGAVTLGAVAIILGLGSRRFAASLPPFVAAYAGDALWAFLVFWLLAVARPRAGTRLLAVSALLIAVLVEMSQLSNTAWLVTARATRLGALVLGQGFLASDLVCYAAGVALAALVDRGLAPKEGGAYEPQARTHRRSEEDLRPLGGLAGWDERGRDPR